MINSELECPLDENIVAAMGEGAASLLTECHDKISDWATAYMWTCRTDYFFKRAQFNASSKIYAAELNVGKAGPNHGEDGVQQPDIDDMTNCYASGGGKSCHIEGQPYLFGEIHHQNTATTEEVANFQDNYQTNIGALIKGEQTNLISFSGNVVYNVFDLDNGLSMSPVSSFPVACHVHDQQIYPAQGF